jgi:hypothetical protein
MSGATNATFTTPKLTANKTYWARVSNAVGAANSQAATIAVNSPPTITQQPQSQTIMRGEVATLTVEVSGTAPHDYQWYEGPSGTTTSPVPGATAEAFTTPTLRSNKSYWIRVSNAAGAANSQTATIAVAIPPRPPILYAVEVRDEKLRLTITGPVGSFWRVWRSTDLVDWYPMDDPGTVELLTEEATIDVPLSGAPAAFHRLVQEP